MGGELRHVVAAEPHHAGRRLDQPVDHLERRGLPAPRSAEQDEQLPVANLERQIAYRDLVTVILGQVLQLDHATSGVRMRPRAPRVRLRLGVRRHATDHLELIEPVGLVVSLADDESPQILVVLGLVVAQVDVLVVDAHDFDFSGLVGHA